MRSNLLHKSDRGGTNESLSRHCDCDLGPYLTRVAARLAEWDAVDFGARLWRKDATLWFRKKRPEITDRLDWLDLPRIMTARATALAAFAGEVRRDGLDQFVVLGMGGSSLAAGVFAAAFESASGHAPLIVLDTTHPAAIEAALHRIDLARTLFVVSSKSGTTLEPIALFRFFWDRVARAVPHPGRHFVAVTDPDTPLAELAGDRQFRDAFLAPPDLGGRYSALSEYGLLPAALIGLDIADLLRRAGGMAQSCGRAAAAADNPGLVLGAVLGELALAGRNKATFLTSSAFAAMPIWLEQLIAESTGKSGRGIVPVAGELAGEAGRYGGDRLFIGLVARADDGDGVVDALDRLAAAGHPVVRMRLGGPADLAAEMFRWEVAIAAAGAILGIHPFDQPDVELAKQLARQAMAEPGAARAGGDAEEPVATDEAEVLASRLADWLRTAEPQGYVAIQAFLAETPETTLGLQRLRHALRDRLGLATTIGYGPRFLNSTGQLHKGGPDGGLFLQLTDEPRAKLPVPEAGYDFGTVISAQALGDARALTQRRRAVLRVKLTGTVTGALDQIMAALGQTVVG